MLTHEQKDLLLRQYLNVRFPDTLEPRPCAGQHVTESGVGNLFHRAILEAFRYSSLAQYMKMKQLWPNLAELFDHWSKYGLSEDSGGHDDMRQT
jgi:hypothetical protein